MARIQPLLQRRQTRLTWAPKMGPCHMCTRPGSPVPRSRGMPFSGTWNRFLNRLATMCSFDTPLQPQKMQVLPAMARPSSRHRRYLGASKYLLNLVPDMDWLDFVSVRVAFYLVAKITQ